MATLVLSDLHLGSRTDADVLRDPDALARLTAAIGDLAPDRLVLLGDVLELRHGPVADTLERAGPAVEAIGAALPDATPVVLVPGNHDHELITPWLEDRALRRAGPLGLEERAGGDVSPPVAALTGWLAPATVEVAYPGVWLRDDVYATHGHFLDRHVTVPTFERVALGVLGRVLGRTPEHAATAEDYEAALAPLYAWMHAVARHTTSDFGAERQRGSQNAWQVLTAKGPRPLRHRMLSAGFPAAVAALNLAGAGPLRSELSVAELRRAGLLAMGEVCRRLGIDAGWVLFGHTHRAGPLDGDDVTEWRAGPDGPRLVNTGSWVAEDVLVGRRRAQSPYWPGTIVEVGADGPPRVRNLLRDWEAAPTPRPA